MKEKEMRKGRKRGKYDIEGRGKETTGEQSIKQERTEIRGV